jgi:hypothetical protein
LEFVPCLTRSVAGGTEIISLGHPLLDDYLAFCGEMGVKPDPFIYS